MVTSGDACKRAGQEASLTNLDKPPNQWRIDAAVTIDMPIKLRERLESQGYHILGRRGAFKACQWQRRSLVTGDHCYKQRFYGIKSHRCVQMTPVVDKCSQNCEFCWRTTPADIREHWDQANVGTEEVDPAAELLDATLMANIRSLGGYNPKAGANVSEQMYQEARRPKHVAISLAGEPTLYPFLNELIEEISKRNMTSFLVTNGQQPEVISGLTMPTQLYVTLAAPDENTLKHLCHPVHRDAWTRLNETQEILNSLTGRTVNRLTMVSKRNMVDPRAYSRLILKGEPDFVEVKGYMYLGSSRGRMHPWNAPSHAEIRSFSEKISSLTGYYLVDEQIESRVVLLSKKKQVDRLG